MLSVKEAADRVGRKRQTIWSAIKNGRITATKNEFGDWEIDPSELFRVYEPVEEDETDNDKFVDKEENKSDIIEQRILQIENDFLRQLLEEKDKQLEDLRRLLPPPPKQDNRKDAQGFWYHMKAAFKA